LTFHEFSCRADLAPAEFRHNRYGVLAHGVGLCDEWPSLYFPEDWPSSGYDGVFEEGMTICIESYCGSVGGCEGIKLEQQIYVTGNGSEDLTSYPWESSFLT
jgi:Xaa-Pro aminopeptidase